MATTSPDGIVSPDSDQPVDWVGDWAATASSVQTALSNRAVKTGTTAQRNSATGVQEGTLWYDTTNGVVYRYSSSTWAAVTESNIQETIDGTPWISSGFTGSISGVKMGRLVTLYVDITASSGTLGAPTSSTNIASITNSGWRPVPGIAVTTGARTVQPGSGFGGGFLLFSSGGNVSIQGQRSGDNRVSGGVTFLTT